MQKPSREKMIEWLVDSDINDWYDKADQADYLSFLLRTGFIGYEKQSYEELEQECRDRDMWDILLEQEEQNA